MAHTVSMFLVFLLCTGAVLCALVAICYPRISKSYPLNQRLEGVAPTRKDGRAGNRENDGEGARKRSIEATLRENADAAAAKAKNTKPSLTARLRQAQLNWGKKTYYAMCLIRSEERRVGKDGS